MFISDVNEILSSWPKLQYLDIPSRLINKDLLSLEVQKCPLLKEICVQGSPEDFGASLAKPNDLRIDKFTCTPDFLIGDGPKEKEVTSIFYRISTYIKGDRRTLIKDYFTGNIFGSSVFSNS